MTQSTSPICPHLGLAGDRTVVRTTPDAAHRCFAQTPPGAPDLGHQAGFCLAAGHTGCPFYVAPAPDETGLGLRRSAAATSGRRSRRAWLWAILALLVLAVAAVYAWDLLRPPAAPAPIPAGAAEVTAPAATRPPSSPIAGAAVTGAEPAAAQTGAGSPAAGERAGTATPEPGGRILELAPKAGSAGWWTGSEARGNHLGDSYLYAGHYDGQPFISAILFDLAGVPRGAPIKEATLKLTGLQADRFDAGAGGTWTVQLLAAENFKALTDGPARADFQQIYSAPAAVTLLPTLFPADLGQNRANLLSLDASGREWLAQQVVNGAPYVVARIVGPTGGNDSLFAWDSGAGPATGGEAPKLTLSLGAAPPTPPPLPTEVMIVVTFTPTPANVLTVAAQAQTATAAATAFGTPTPPEYRLVTPTPIPANMATAQALGFAKGLPPIVESTPVPANAGTATALARYATAVAVTTGTFTPVPADAVTPVVVLPTPIPRNVLTAAARVRAATATAAQAGTGTPLPFNAVIATLTPEPFIIIDTATPGNAATAQALAAYATAVAVTTGTFTPFPPGSLRATGTPVPTPLPLVLFMDQLPPTVRPSPTPAIPSTMPRVLAGKILFVSDREGEPRLFALDPANGRLAYVTQSWPYSLAQLREPRSPEGNRSVLVADNNVRVPQIYLRDAQFGDALTQLTTTTGMSYDPVWSPVENRIAFVSEEPGNAEIYTVGADGNEFRRLTENVWEWDKHPSWSPDGKQIVFWSNRITGRRQLWVMNADGSEQRPLMDSPYNDWDPIWVK
jgi:hypothetical protein